MGIKSKFKDFFNIKNSAEISEGTFEKIMYQYFYGENSGSVYIDSSTAMQLGAVSTCVSIISSDIGLLPLELRKYRDIRDHSKGSDPAIDHPLYNVLKVKSNRDMVAYNYKERVTSDLLLSGNHYSLKQINNRGQVVSLFPLEWEMMTPKQDEKTNNIYYEYYDSKSKQKIKYRQDEILHVSGYGNGFIGLSPIGIKRESIGLAMSADKFAKQFYDQGVNAGVSITMPGSIKDSDGLRKELKEKYGGLKNAHKPLILEDGMTVQRLAIPLKDTLFLDSRKFQTLEIASWYRVPPKMLGNHEYSTYSNNEQQALDYVQQAILPWGERLENFFNCQLLTNKNIKDGYFTQFDYSVLLKADSKTRAEVLQMWRQNGIVSTNEVRARENMNPIDIDGADDYYINSAMMKLGGENNGKVLENNK